MKTRAEALAEGYTIDDSASGRPWAYKGDRFGGRGDAFAIHTDMEVNLLAHIHALALKVIDLEDEITRLRELIAFCEGKFAQQRRLK